MFDKISKLHAQKVTGLLAAADHLFTVAVDSELLWKTYLDSFPPGTNEVYRKNREYDCSCCRHFLRDVGNVVAVDAAGNIRSIWGVNIENPSIQPVLVALDEIIINAPINGLFVTKQAKFGNPKTKEANPTGITTYHHWYLDIPKRFVYDGTGIGTGTISGLRADARTNRDMFEKSLKEISIEAIEVVLDLIAQNTLYRGKEWGDTLSLFLLLKHEYDRMVGNLTDDRELVDLENWLWIKSVVSPVICRLKNLSIGTLLLDLTAGTDLDEALRKYEAVVAPANYMRPKAVITPKMVDAARKTIEQLGFMLALPRRFARLDDITINDMLFADRSIGGPVQSSVFDSLKKSAVVAPKSFAGVEEIGIEQFIRDVLPRTDSLKVLVENKHASNFVSIIAPEDETAPSMFKWGNNFGWSYINNMADSMRELVKKAGGAVDGVLRFSIQWNFRGPYNRNDYDAHCTEPDHNEIYYASPRSQITHGVLDVDIIRPDNGQPAVENITWQSTAKMKPGIYLFRVHCFNHRGGTDGFDAEVEFGDNLIHIEYPCDIKHNNYIDIARVSYDGKGGFKLESSLPSSNVSKTIWGVTTGQFVPVKAVMLSPNYWGGAAVGNKHYIFALKDCLSDEEPNGFFNEFLIHDLMPHKKVFEALGKEMRVKPSADQISGIGFSATKRASVVVEVSGYIKRVLKINF